MSFAFHILSVTCSLTRALSQSLAHMQHSCPNMPPKKAPRVCTLIFMYASLYPVGEPLSAATPSLCWFLGVAEDCCMLSILLTVPSCFNSFWARCHPYILLHDFSHLIMCLMIVHVYTCTLYMSKSLERRFFGHCVES